jgi:hypothetical protein
MPKNADLDKALSLCKGRWQRAVILGWANYSCSDLKGVAKKYVGKYKRSRDNLISRMDGAGVRYTITRSRRGKFTLIIGEREMFLENFRKLYGARNPELLKKLERATSSNYRYQIIRTMAELAAEQYNEA